MTLLKTELDLLLFMMENTTVQRSQLLNRFELSSRTVDRYISKLVDKQFVTKDSSTKDPVLSFNWDYFDYLSTQKKKEYRRGRWTVAESLVNFIIV